MPYQSLLDGLVRDAEGVICALLLDSEGEVAMEAGARDERHRLIGAYQAIVLSLARRTGDRYGLGVPRYLSCRYEHGVVLVRPLRDGYYLLISIGRGVSLAAVLHRSEEVQRLLDEAL